MTYCEHFQDGYLVWEVKTTIPNISVCHVINISDGIAILFIMCSRIMFYHNCEERNAVTYGTAMNISKLAA